MDELEQALRSLGQTFPTELPAVDRLERRVRRKRARRRITVVAAVVLVAAAVAVAVATGVGRGSGPSVRTVAHPDSPRACPATAPSSSTTSYVEGVDSHATKVVLDELLGQFDANVIYARTDRSGLHVGAACGDVMITVEAAPAVMSVSQFDSPTQGTTVESSGSISTALSPAAAQKLTGLPDGVHGRVTRDPAFTEVDTLRTGDPGFFVQIVFTSRTETRSSVDDETISRAVEMAVAITQAHL